MHWSKLANNSRFYFLTGSILVSVLVVCGLRLAVPSDQLFLIRTQQVYGALAVLLLYIAVILTPLSKVAKQMKGMSLLLFTRRAIGVSAWYFATLHTLIVLFGQVGGWSGIMLLPGRFKVAFIFGLTTLVILFLMAVTSFDKAIKIMTFPRWKQLHRFVYLAGLAVIVHVWLIGTHAQYAWLRAVAVFALVLLFALEAIRITKILALKYKLEAEARLAVGLLAFGVLMGLVFLLPVVAPNYHTTHQAAHEGH